MTYSDEVLADSPLVYWRMDESTGAAAPLDSSGNARHGSYNAGATPGFASLLPAEPGGKSVDINGGSQSVFRSHEAWMNVTNITVEGWFILDGPPAASGLHALLQKDNYDTSFSSRAWRLSVADSTGALTWSGFVTSTTRFSAVSAAGVIARDTVYHIVGTYNGTIARLYVNGVEVATHTLSGTLRTSTYALQVGKDSSGAGYTMNGRADEIAMYGTVLSAARVLAHYQAGAGTGAIEIGRATEAQDAQPLGLTAAMGRAVETDAAAPLTPTYVIGRAVEADAAQPLGMSLGIDRAEEADHGRVFGAQPVSITIGRAVETDIARPVDVLVLVYGQTQTLTLDVNPGAPRVIGPMELVILDDTLDRAPTSVQVTVSNCAELDELTFDIDGTVVFVESSDADGQLDMTSIPVPDEIVAGTHTLTVTSAIKGTSSAQFTLARNAAASPAVQVTDAEPVLIPAAQDGDRRHWVLQDLAPGGLGSWVMPVSPTSMSNPHVRRNVSVQHTTAIVGADHAYEGHMPPLDWQFAGYSPDQESYNQLRAYMELNRRFYVIDHRGRAWTVAGVHVDFRARKRQVVDGELRDWHHDYTAHCVLLDQQWKEPA